MKFLTRINVYRRHFMRSITKNIGKSGTDKSIVLHDHAVRRVLISRPNNRLGNLLLITPLLQELSGNFPGCTIDLFVRGNAARILFKNYENIDRVIKLPGKPFKHLVDYTGAWITLRSRRYDLVINVVKNSSSGRLSTKFCRAKYKLFGDVDGNLQLACNDHCHVAKYPVYNLRRFLAQSVLTKPVPLLNLKLSAAEIRRGRELLDDIVKNDKKTISIFTFATGDKRYSEQWWEVFYARLMDEYAAEYNIVEVLPIENVSQIGFKAPSFYGKDIRELGALLANTVLFIGADSGIMHLASAVHTSTVGLFSVTNPAIFGPYGNHSIAIDTNAGTVDEWMVRIDGVLNAKDEKYQALL
jgi:heptosyltransferase-3